jgi:hypothetical protein
MQSRRWFDYYTDGGIKCAIERDESNTRSVNPIADVGAITTSNSIQKGIKPRYVTVQFPSGAIRNCVVLRPATMANLQIGGQIVNSAFEADDVVGQTGVIIYRTGEKLRRQPRSSDTGQTDNTQP